MFIIEPFFINRPVRAATMLFHVYGIHIAVFVEREQEPLDRPIGIFFGRRVIVAEGFVVG
jgi:hypothetical protein